MVSPWHHRAGSQGLAPHVGGIKFCGIKPVGVGWYGGKILPGQVGDQDHGVVVFGQERHDKAAAAQASQPHAESATAA